jgi:hypothetical protein
MIAARLYPFYPFSSTSTKLYAPKRQKPLRFPPHCTLPQLVDCPQIKKHRLLYFLYKENYLCTLIEKDIAL